MSVVAATTADVPVTWRVGGRGVECVDALVLRAVADHEFGHYSAVAGVVERLRAVVTEESPRLLAAHAHALDGLARIVSGVATTDATSAGALSLERRISRESAALVRDVDGIARFVLDALGACPSLERVVIEVDGFERVDRPSMRVLHRVVVLGRLAHLGDRLRLLGICETDPTDPARSVSAAPDRFDERIAAARVQLFRYVRALVDPEVEVEIDPVFAGAVPAMAPAAPLSRDACVRAIRSCLTHQNYERVYVLARAADAWAPADRAEIESLVALVDVNIGRPDLADDALQRALAASTTPSFAAHLHYLRGLILTKRGGDTDAARRCYAAGLDILDANHGHGADDDLERAWILNGQALLDSLAAASVRGATRTAMLEDAMRTEIRAFRLAGDRQDRASIYLRYNLLANIGFLFEMLGRFDDAIAFWRRAFGEYAHSADETQFAATYHYRLGLLHWKAGGADAALDALDQAARAARALDDRFAEERCLYALGWVAIQARRVDAAQHAFTRGEAVATANGDAEAAERHRAGREAAALGVADDLVVPPPKLLSYFPAVDLEPPPDRDLNQFLADIGRERKA